MILPMPLKNPKSQKLFIIPTSQPVLLGIYEEDKLTQTFELNKPLSDGLVPLFAEISKQYPHLQSLYFIRGPGSFMALKLFYLFAKTLEIAKKFEILAACGFDFNQKSPIKAYGNCYFVCDKDNHIILKNFPTPPLIAPYTLPKILDLNLFNKELEPLYILPCVKETK